MAQKEERSGKPETHPPLSSLLNMSDTLPSPLLQLILTSQARQVYSPQDHHYMARARHIWQLAQVYQLESADRSPLSVASPYSHWD